MGPRLPVWRRMGGWLSAAGVGQTSQGGLGHADARGRLQWAEIAELGFFLPLEYKTSEKQRTIVSKNDSLALHGHWLDCYYFHWRLSGPTLVLAYRWGHCL